MSGNIIAAFRSIALLPAACLMLLLAGCGEDEAKHAAPAGPLKTYSAGACRVTLSATAASLNVAQTLRVQLTADYPEGWTVRFPEFKDKWGDFNLDQSISGDPQLLPDGKTVRRVQTVSLLPYLAGEYKLPALMIQFSGTNAAGGSTAEGAALSGQSPVGESIQTEELRFPVLPVIPPTEHAPALRDITGPHWLATGSFPWLALLIGAFVLLSALGWLLMRRLRRHAATVVELSAQELALEELQRLLNRDLPATGRYKEFYLGLSDILRQYIERRFLLAAPERTTEEFLEELRTQPVLSEPHTLLLKDFLRHCDLVKFARYQPVRTEIEASAACCRRFVVETPMPQEPESPSPKA